MRRTTLAVGVVGILAALSLGVGTAKAGLTGCPYPPGTQAFAQWGDGASYVPVPGGSFEYGAGWTLAGGARIVDGNEPFGLAGGSHSLLLPPGSSAMTPAVCLAILTPSIRFVGSSSDGSPVRVSIYTRTVFGLLKVASFGLMSVDSSWAPSSVENFTLDNVLGLLSLSSANVYFQFQPASGATVQMDDLFLDPFLWG